MTESTINIGNKVKKRECLLSVLVISLGFAFNLCVFAPMDSFLAGAEEFWFSGVSLLLPVLALFGACFLLLGLLLYLLPQRVGRVVSCLVFSLNIAFYIEGNYLMRGYPLLDGTPIPWDEMVTRGLLDTAMWLVILLIPFLIYKFLPKYFKTVLIFVTGVIFLMELSTLIITALITPSRQVNDAYLSIEEEFEISKNDNIITVLPDTFEAKYMRRALKEFPELKEKLKGFTFYENTSGVSSFTHLSMPKLITGNLVPVGSGYIDGAQKTFEDRSFFDFMHDKGYEVNVFSDSRFVTNNDLGTIDNLKRRELSAALKVDIANAGLMYKYSAFKYMPHFAKRFFLMETGDFGKTQSLLHDPAYYFSDHDFYSRFKEKGIKAVKDKNVYTMYHLNGVHAPYTIDREMNPVDYNDSDDKLSFEEQRYENALGELKLFIEMLESMKGQDAYDRSTVIYTTDHGFANRFDTLLMVKPKGETGEFKISEAPMSLSQDYVELIKDTAAGKGMDAAFYNVDKNRERYVYNYMSDSDGYGVRSNCRSKILVDGKSEDIESYKLVEDEFADEPEYVNYTLGDSLALNEDSPGILGVIDGSGWSYAGSAKIRLNPNKKAELKGEVSFKDLAGDSQQMEIFVNGSLVSDTVVNRGETSVRFTVPLEISQQGELDMEIKFPQATFYGDQGGVLNSFKFTAFQFESLCLTAS